ncbi:hypothetical protein T310_6754 [Rasamsonia emersonii CBS 393.64]|uniref:Acyl CoA binding protein n=1 Tax=Rasamsonia emersonii (strain ATCC 16479 / CBS 393.64 / IMI 116815) TaxID=1408163 RepID=A0A0F4YN43_RASE3|nr:hypothetical protein T310_6754 [Rasamsonia emersonii CBS 393.64]KKA19266.1 hypothetical protein T310_6754 [Rasamsonia emersonii CBS 393.64]
MSDSVEKSGARTNSGCRHSQKEMSKGSWIVQLGTGRMFKPNAKNGLSRTEAKRRYITTLIDTMHRYASQTAEARELVSELEFVWDQVKSNTSTSSSSSPMQPVSMPIASGLQPQPHYGSIDSRMSRRNPNDDGDEDLAVYARRDSRLRVLSPVSQPEEEEMQDSEDEDEEENYEEARDVPYDEDEEDDDNMPHGRRTGRTGRGPQRDISSRKWRRRVEQALTKMTAEIAALREQMESRAVSSRRRSSLWAWLKWLFWVAMRQILWDMTLLVIVLIWLRMKGDRRLEQKVKAGLVELKTRLTRLRLPKRLPRLPSLP